MDAFERCLVEPVLLSQSLILILEILIVGQEVVRLDRFRWIIFLIGGKRIKAVETLHKR